MKLKVRMLMPNGGFDAFTFRNDSYVRESAMDSCYVRQIHLGCRYPCHDDQSWWPTCANFFATYSSLLSMHANVTRIFSTCDYCWRCYSATFSILHVHEEIEMIFIIILMKMFNGIFQITHCLQPV